ncbi:unnamed protein product, partial [Prorocentrum cordatum]
AESTSTFSLPSASPAGPAMSDAASAASLDGIAQGWEPASTFPTQEAAAVAAAEDAAKRQRIAHAVAPEDAASLKEYVDTTKKSMLAALANVQNSVATLTNTFTSSWNDIDKRTEARLNGVECRQSAQEARIDVLEGQIRSLTETLGDIKAARPAPAAAPGFNRNTDPTILLLRTKLSCAKAGVLAALSDWLGRAQLNESDFSVEGEPVSNRYILRINGSVPYASRKVQQALGALRRHDQTWERFQCQAPDNSTQEIFISGDKNVAQVKGELGLKRVRRELELHYGHLRFYSDKDKGEISCQWKPLVHVEPQAGEAPPKLSFCLANLNALGIDKTKILDGVMAGFKSASEALFHYKAGIRSRKLALARSLWKTGSIISLQETRGTMTELRDFAYFSNSAFSFASSFWASGYHIFMFISMGFLWENGTSLLRLVIVAGDLNLADSARRSLGADSSIDPLDTLRDWRASRGAILSPVFSSMTEIETPDPAHYNRALGTLNTIDPIFVSFPGWVCNQLFTSGQARIMREAASVARNAMIVKRPESIDTKFLIIKSISRAVWRQDIILAERLRASHFLARQYLDVDVLARTVTLLRVFEFLQVSSELHRSISEREQAEIRASLTRVQSESQKRKLKRRLRAVVQRSRLWSPFDRRVSLRGVPCGDGVCTEPGKMVEVLSRHWSSVFSKKQIDSKSAQRYFDRFGVSPDLMNLPPPPLRSVKKCIQGLEHSAPGPDGLPFAAWQGHPEGFLILDKMMWWILNGNPPMASFSDLRKVFVPKGSEASDEIAIHRGPNQTRPLGLKNAANNIFTGIVCRELSKTLDTFTAPIQRGFVGGRNFGTNILELDTYSWVYGMHIADPNVAISHKPVLVSFDYGQAFPSIAHEWLLMCLRRLRILSPLLFFFEILYSAVRCFVRTNNALRFAFKIESGIIQGCPASGMIYAIASNPFLSDID